MLSARLHKHLDGMEEIEARAQNDIDSIVSSIDKKLLLENPSEALMQVVDEVSRLMQEKYIPMAIEDGLDLKKDLDKYDKQGKEILIDGSKDPHENKELFQ